jgi:hypothetical protein
LFNLGRFGIPINLLAVVWGIAMAVNLAWPRAEVYTPSGGSWWMLWAAPLFVVLVIAVGVVVHRFVNAGPRRVQSAEPAVQPA